jgi:hypothetical protein
MSAARAEMIRDRMARLLRSLELEDLEERVAPVKCAKHPDNPSCMEDNGAPVYGEPAYGAPTPTPGGGADGGGT